MNILLKGWRNLHPFVSLSPWIIVENSCLILEAMAELMSGSLLEVCVIVGHP